MGYVGSLRAHVKCLRVVAGIGVLSGFAVLVTAMDGWALLIAVPAAWGAWLLADVLDSFARVADDARTVADAFNRSKADQSRR